MSSLSLGSRERVREQRHDTFYLPSCNLLRSAQRLSGTPAVSRTSMHVGEDVDLTWRLRDAGWTIAYLPAGNVLHEHRSSLRSFMSRRFDYGTSEGMLQTAPPSAEEADGHPAARWRSCCCSGLTAPFAGWWTLLLAAGLLVTDAAVVRVRFTRRRLPIGLVPLIAGRLRALGSLAYYLSYHLVRYYAAPLIVIALIVPGFWAWCPAACGPAVRSRGRSCRQETAAVVHPLLRASICWNRLPTAPGFSGAVCSRKMFCQLPGCPASVNDGADSLKSLILLRACPPKGILPWQQAIGLCGKRRSLPLKRRISPVPSAQSTKGRRTANGQDCTN